VVEVPSRFAEGYLSLDLLSQRMAPFTAREWRQLR
jgi:hypothetical protein